MSFLIDLECGACGEHHAADELQNLCPACGKPLLARYDLTLAGQTLTKETLELREPPLWRYREVLPVREDDYIVSLGEGGTPLVHTDRLGETLGMPAGVLLVSEDITEAVMEREKREKPCANWSTRW